MRNFINIFAVVILASCKTGIQSPDMKSDNLNQKWELNMLDGQNVMASSPIYIEFLKDNKVAGFIGCNRVTGSYTVMNKTQIKFNQLAATRMMCAPAEMAMETKVLEMLNTTDNFTISEGKLMLNVGRRAPLATFIAMSDNEIVNKYWKLKTLEGMAVTMKPNQEKEQFFMLRSDGTLSGFAGCNLFNGEYEIMKGNRISIKRNMAMTLRACPDVNVDEMAFMNIFDQADNYTINGDVLQLNVGKRAPLAVFEAVYF